MALRSRAPCRGPMCSLDLNGTASSSRVCDFDCIDYELPLCTVREI